MNECIRWPHRVERLRLYIPLWNQRKKGLKLGPYSELSSLELLLVALNSPMKLGAGVMETGTLEVDA